MADEAGRNKWLVISADTRIRYRANERAALMAAGVLAVVVTSPNLTGAELVDLLIRALPRLKHFSYKCSASGDLPAAQRWQTYSS
jgi:hypothetical protein